MGELSSYWGCVDGVFNDVLHGWAMNRADPSERVELDLVVNGKAWHRVRAELFREDLKAGGQGDGSYSFQVPLSRLALPGGEPLRWVSVYVTSERRELPRSPWLAPEDAAEGVVPFCAVSPLNVTGALQRLRGKAVDCLLVDSNNLCNADCVYCPHSRGPEQLEIARFEELLNECVASINLFQLGCGQEPTADWRLGTFLKLARESRAAPKRLQLITNGTLLDRHDPKIFQETRLDSLMLSIDTVNSEVNARLRAGTDLSRMLRNLEAFREACPWAQIQFSIVVTSETIGGLRELVEYGKQIKVTGYFFREVASFFTLEDRPRRADFDEWMGRLRLPPGRFERFGAEEVATFGIDGKYVLLPDRKLQHNDSSSKYAAKRPSRSLDGP